MSYVPVAGLGQVLPAKRPLSPTVLRVPRVIRKGLAGLGQTELLTACQTSSGAAGQQVVDASGNVIYSCDQVAANPALANIPAANCPSGMIPLWYPGGQSECGVPPGTNPTCSDPTGVCGNYIIPGNTPNYVNGWNLVQGGDFNNSADWVWYPANTTPTTPNPAIAYNAPSLPANYTTPAAATSTPATSNVPVSASIANVSRPGQSIQVGDTWQVAVKGAPNSPVTNSASQNGQSLGSSNYGSTDSNGNFSLQGQATSSTVGSWMEQWAVGGVNAAPLMFSVSAAPVAASSGGGSSAIVGTSTGVIPLSITSPSQPATPSATGCFSLLSQFGLPDPCVFGVGLGTVAAGVVGLMILGSLFGGKR